MSLFRKQVETNCLPRVYCVIDPYGDGYKGELNVSFPDCSHNIKVRLKSESGRAKILKMFDATKPTTVEVLRFYVLGLSSLRGAHLPGRFDVGL